MTDDEIINSANNSKRTTQPVLFVTGVGSVLFAAILTGRIIWEETWLTMRHGPQMIGFSLAHGAGAILFLAPLILVAWFAVTVTFIAVTLLRKRLVSKALWSCLSAALVIFGVMSLPPVFFQWLFIGSFARTAHASDLMIDAAANGDLRTVRAYLAAGVPLEARNYNGATAVFAAATRGRVSTLEMLAVRGANLDATNSTGDSPLEAAVKQHDDVVSRFLMEHGAHQINGDEERWNAIVREHTEDRNIR